MQIFKCVRRSAQNLIEFMFVLPILILVTLAIFEVALFWQDVNAIYNLNAEINANVALVDNSNMALGDRCAAAKIAIGILKAKNSTISLVNASYNDLAPVNDPGLIVDGSEPFALYKYVSSTKATDANGHPQALTTLWVDCRNPFEDGVTTQIQFYHKTLIMKASIPRFDNDNPIVIIPDNIFIASSKLNTIRHY